MTALIFGANGQDGYYLSELLQQKGCRIIGVSRNGNYIRGNVADPVLVKDLIAVNKPDYIFHLAANSTTSAEAFRENQQTILQGTVNILESVKEASTESKVFISGSGLQFKNEGKPIKETDAFEVRETYSLLRIQSVDAARDFRHQDVQVYVGYFFNHDSPRRAERHMSKKISEAAKRIARGSREKLEVGDVSVVKEYTYAGDIAKGIWTLVNQESIMEANISSGKGYSIEEWLQQCFSLVNKCWQDHVMIKKGFVAEYKRLISDPSLIFSLGWKPEVSFEELAQLMMAD
jgi:GDPmannose 4,6-dehydratase